MLRERRFLTALGIYPAVVIVMNSDEMTKIQTPSVSSRAMINEKAYAGGKRVNESKAMKQQ